MDKEGRGGAARELMANHTRARLHGADSLPMQQDYYGPPSSSQSGGWNQRSGIPSGSPTDVKKATVWEAPTQEELKYKADLESTQLQKGFTHPQTMKAMWQLGQYYMSAQKYSQAAKTLGELKDAAQKNIANSPLSLDKINVAYEQAQSEMRKAQTASISHVPSPSSNMNQRQYSNQNQNQNHGQGYYNQSPHGHRNHRHHHFMPYNGTP
jgi:hypothetical protein